MNEKLTLVTKAVVKDIENETEENISLYLTLQVGELIEEKPIYRWKLLLDNQDSNMFYLQYRLSSKSSYVMTIPFYASGISALNDNLYLYAKIKEPKWQPALGEKFVGLSLDNIYCLDIFSYRNDKYWHGIANMAYTHVLPLNEETINLIGKKL